MGNDDNIPILNVGIVGHIDHGKTTLLYKLTGKWTDTHSEELKRGITIRLGYADIVLSKDKEGYNKDGKGEAVRQVSFVDAPGHEMLMATMLSGAALVDAALLVVAANEGIKPQTREHLLALHAKKISNVIVIQNKVDLVSLEQAKKNYLDIKALLKGKYDDAIIIPVSAQQGVNLNFIYESLAEVNIPNRDENGLPIFLVARSFDINKPGTTPEQLNGAVLGGTLRKGTLKVGDEIELKPGRLVKELNQYHYEPVITKVKKLFRGSKELQTITPGGSMSIETELDMSLAKADMLAGNVVSLKGKLPAAVSTLKISYSLFPEVFGTGVKTSVEPIKMSEMLFLSVNTSMVVGVVKKISGKEIEFSLKLPLVPFKDDNLGIARNINNHWCLIGHGNVI